MSIKAHISKLAAEWLTNQLTDSQIYGFLTSMSDAVDYFFKGFQISQENAGKPTIRRRFAKEIYRSAEFCELVLQAPMMPWKDWQLLIGRLSSDWLIENWRSCLRSKEGRGFAIAMALDIREPVQKRGRRIIRQSNYWQREFEIHLRDLHDWAVLVPLFRKIFASEKNDEKAGTEAPQATQKLQRRIEVLEKEKEKFTKQLRKERGELRLLHEEKERFQKKYDAERRELRDELQLTKEQLAEKQGQWKSFVQREVQSFRQHILGITPELEKIQEKIKAADRGDFESRVQEVLAGQLHMNQKHGIKSQIRERLQNIQRLRKSLHQAVEESVVVLPETQSLYTDLQAEERRLQMLLDESKEKQPESEIEHELLSLIKTWLGNDYAAAKRKLAEVDELLQQPPLIALLQPEALNRLYYAVQEKRKLIASLQAEDVAATIAVQNDKDIEPGPREIWNLADALRLPENENVWLFVDGYNVIHRVQPLAGRCETEPLADVRNDFCRLCSNVALKFGHLELVFDGTGSISSRERYAENVSVVFAAHSEESQNADRYIANRLNAVRKNVDRLWLVTDDFGLRRIVASTCDAFIRSDDFYFFLTKEKL